MKDEMQTINCQRQTRRSPFLAALLLLQVFVSTLVDAAALTNLAAHSDLQEGPGLAARFKADSGIATNSAVIFAEDFEMGELGARWDEQTAAKARALSLAPAQGEVCGKRCLKVEARLG